MTQHRIQLRQIAFDAISAGLRFRRFTGLKGWSQSVDSETLPVFGVSTPRETSNAISTTSHARSVDLMVGVKRMADEAIEEALDLDAEAIEALVLPTLRAVCIHAEIAQTEIRLAGEGRARVGMIEVTFRCMIYTDIPV